MIEDNLTNPFDYYDIDPSSVGKPWLNVDGGAGIHHHLMLEVLPTLASESWLKKFIVSQYRWKLSIWNSRNERISADMILPIITAKQHQFERGSAYNPSNGDVGNANSKVIGKREVLIFDLDCASITLSESLGEVDKGKALKRGKNKKIWLPEDGIHLVIELVHEVSGIPVSRGMVNLKPQEELDPSFFKASSLDRSKNHGEATLKLPPPPKAGLLTYNQCYSVAVPLATSEYRTTGLEASIKRASSGADMHVPIQLNIIAVFTKGATRATQWGARKINDINRYVNQATVARNATNLNVKLTSFPSHVPSLAEVLPSTLRYRLPSAEDEGYGTDNNDKGQTSHMTSGASNRPMSPAKQAREEMYSHLSEKARAVRVYATVGDMHISEDLLELCKADRVVLTAHCVDPEQLPTNHNVFQNNSDAISAAITSAKQDIAAALITGADTSAGAAKEASNDEEERATIAAETVSGGARMVASASATGTSKAMYPTPLSHPSARPTALAEMASNNVGDYHRCCELLTPTLEGHISMKSGLHNGNSMRASTHNHSSQTELGPERSLTSLYPSRGHNNEHQGQGLGRRAKHHTDCVPRIVQLALMGFSCVGDNTQLMREHIKFVHKDVELCSGQLTLDDLVVRDDGEERDLRQYDGDNHDNDESDFAGLEAGAPLVSGLYRVPMYTEPTRVVIGAKPASGAPTGVLVGEVFVHIAVQRDAGLDVHRLHSDPHYPSSVNIGHNPGSPSQYPRDGGGGVYASATGGGLLPSPTLQASQTPEAVAARLMDMLESPRSLTAHRILQCVSGDSVHVLKAEEKRERMRATGVSLPYDEDEDEEEEEDMHDSGETEEGGSIITSRLLPAVLSIFTSLFVPLSASAIIDLVVTVEARLREVGPAAAGATVGAGIYEDGNFHSLISPRGALFIILMMLLERLMIDERNCDSTTVELIARAIDDRGASSVLWHYFQACLRVDTVGAILSLVNDHDEVMQYVDRGHVLEEGQDDAPGAPTALTWRQLRVACFSLRVLAATAWVDRNPRVGDVKDSILAGLPPPPSLKMDGQPGVGMGGGGGRKQRALDVAEHRSRDKQRRSTIGRRASNRTLNRRLSGNVTSHQGSPAPLPKTHRRRSSATHSVHPAVAMPNSAGQSQGYGEEDVEDEDGVDEESDESDDHPYYHTTDSHYHAGGDSHTISLCKDLTVLLLSYARRLSISLLHEYRVCEVTVSEHSEAYRSQGQEDFAQQALRELDNERIEACLDIMSVVRHTMQCVSCLWTLFKPSDLDKEMVELLLALVKVLPVTPLVRDDLDDFEGMEEIYTSHEAEEQHEEEEEDVALRQQRQKRLHFLVNSVVTLVGQLTTSSILRHCSDLEVCGKVNVRRFTQTSIFAQIQSEGKYNARTASEPMPHFSSPYRQVQAEPDLHPQTRTMIEAEYGKGQLLSSLVTLYAAFSSRVYAPVSARKKFDDSIDPSIAAALTLHLIAGTIYSCFHRRLHLPSESVVLSDNTSQGFGESLSQVATLMPRGERRKNKGKSTKQLAPSVQRIRSASLTPGGGQAIIASVPDLQGSPQNSPGLPGSLRGQTSAFQYNIPEMNTSTSDWTGSFQTQAQAESIYPYHQKYAQEDGQRVLFGNEAIIFVAERYEMLKAITSLLGTASGASTRTSISSLNRKSSAPRLNPMATSGSASAKDRAGGGSYPVTHLVASGAVVRECVQHLKKVSEMSELLLSAALHAVDGHGRESKNGDASIRRALFVEKGSSEGGVGSSFVILLMLVVTSTREYWREIRRLHILKGDNAITSTADGPSCDHGPSKQKGGGFTSFRGNRKSPNQPFIPVSCPVIAPLIPPADVGPWTPPVSSIGFPYRAQCSSLHEKLERDTSLLVDAASALMTRPEVDKDLSPRETRVYHRHRTRYRTLAYAVAVAAGLAEGSPAPTDAASDYAVGAGHVEDEEDTGVSIVTWLTLRQRLINTIAVVTDVASSMKLFSASAIQTQAEAELYEILIGNKGFGDGEESESDSSGGEPKLSAHKESLRGTKRSGRTAFINRMEALRKLALLHFHGQEEHGAGGASSGAILAGGDMIPLTRLIWLLRDLSDLSPLLDTRPDIALLALSDDHAVRNVLRALVQASLAVPVHIDEDSSIDKSGHHDAKKQNELFVHAFHHRYHKHQENSMHHHHHQGHHAHSHISNDRTRVRNRVAIALHQARQDLISAAITIMQILTTDAAAGAGDLDGDTRGSPPPMRHETYFQSLVDALVLRCIPSKIAVSPASTIGIILGQAHDLTPQGRRAGGRLDHHHYQYGGYNAQTSTGSASRCAATITTIIETLSDAHIQGLGNGNEGEGSQEEVMLSPDALAALLRLRNRLVMRLQAVRMYILARIRTMCFKQNPQNSVVTEAGRVLNKQYSQLAAAAALNNLLHMSPVVHSHSSSFAMTRIPIAGWALGGIERRLVLMEMASLTEQPLGDGQGLAWHMRRAEHGEGHPTGSLSVEGVPLDMVPARWDGQSLDKPPPFSVHTDVEAEEERQKGTTVKDHIKEKAKVWNDIAQREENEQRARHLRLVLPPCPARSTSSGHGAAAKLLLLALFRSKMLPINAVSATAEEFRANRVGPMTNNSDIGPVSHFESKQTRAVLAALLESGDWEIGLSLASIFQSAFADKVKGMAGFLASMRGGSDSTNSHRLGFSASRTTLPRGLSQTHNQQYMAHMRHLLDRATKLAEETAHSEELLKRNLLHEGDSRLLPMYYAVRITACPWTRAPNLATPFNPSPFDKADQAKMEALLTATGMELVGVVLTGEDDDDLMGSVDDTSANDSRSEGESHRGLAEHAHAGNTSLRGTWLLLRFDASAQKSAGHHMRVWSSDVAHYVPPSPAETNEQAHVAPPPVLHATGVGGQLSSGDDDSELSSMAFESTPPTEHLEPAPGAPLPPTARAVIERSFQLAFPHHMVIPADYLAAPTSPIPPPHPSSVATPHAGGLPATAGGSSYHTSAVSGAENASKVIQVFDAFPAPLVDEFYIRKRDAHLRHAQRKESRKTAKTHKGQYAANKRIDSFSAHLSSTVASGSGNNGGFGSSFENFDTPTSGRDRESISPGNANAAHSDPFFSPGQGTMDPWTEYGDSGSSTEDAEDSGDDEIPDNERDDHYDSSLIAKKNRTLERRRTQAGLIDRGRQDVHHGNLRDIAAEDWAAASHADVFYLYVASDPSNIHHGQAHHHHHTHTTESMAEEGKIMTRLTMSVLSVAKGGELSHGHHHVEDENPHSYAHHQPHRAHGGSKRGKSPQQEWYPSEHDHEGNGNEYSNEEGNNDQSNPSNRHTRWAGPLEHAVKALHFVSPCSLLYPVESKHLTAFEAGLEIMWYQAKQVRRLATSIKKSSELTPGEIRSQSQNDLNCLDSVLSGVSTQVMNVLMQPLRNPCSLANSRSLIAGELERLDSAMQKERKMMKRRFIQSKSFPEKYQAGHRSSDFFEEQPVAPDFAALDRKYRHKKHNVNKMIKLREVCFQDLKSAVATFRKCTEKIHHAYEDLGKTAGKPSSLVELSGGMSEAKDNTVDIARNTITLMGTEVDRDDAAQLTDTWTQITLLIESTLASVEIGATI